MSLIIKVIMTLWPFIKEMVLGNKEVREFLREHFWVICNILTSLVLFLIFINVFLVNTQMKLLLTEQSSEIILLKREMAYVKERHGDKITALKERNAGLKEKAEELEAKLSLCEHSQETAQSCKPVMKNPVRVRFPKEETLGHIGYLERLERIRGQEHNRNEE